MAYLLATIKHECADKWQPIKEYRNRPGSKGRANQDRYWLTGYMGRGFCQLTWLDNYRKATRMLKEIGVDVDLVKEPDRAMEPKIASTPISLSILVALR